MDITKKEFIFVALMTLLFIILNNPFAIKFINVYNPLVGYIIYEVFLLSALWILAVFGFSAFGIKIKKFRTILASFLTAFDFFVIINFENAYVSYLTTGSSTIVPAIFMGSEDGILVYLWQFLIPLDSMFHAWLMFIVMAISVFVIAVIVALLVPKNNPPQVQMI